MRDRVKIEMKNERYMLTVVNESGVMLPEAGLWADDYEGKAKAEQFEAVHSRLKVVKATLTETK